MEYGAVIEFRVYGGRELGASKGAYGSFRK